MKQERIILSLIAAIILASGAGLVWVTNREPQPQAQPVTPRRTTLTDTDGNLINIFATQNLSVSGGGTATVDVDTLAQSVTMPSNNTQPITFRNQSGVWQFQNYSSTWKDVGQGGGAAYALAGDGLSSLAEATMDLTGFFDIGSVWTLYGTVSVQQWDRAEAFLTVIENAYSTTILEFGKDVTGHLTLTIGADTYTSVAQVFTSAQENLPIPIGVMYDGDAVVMFTHHHNVEYTTALNNPLPTTVATMTVTLGSGLQGRLFFLGLSPTTLYPNAGGWAITIPLDQRLSQCQYCRWLYDLRDGEGATVTNRVAAVLQNTTSFDLTITGGTWELWENGY